MKILISPAKSINEQCEFPELDFTTPQFAKEATALHAKLKKFSAKKLMEMMHVSKDIAELNVNRYANWYLCDSPTEDVRPAGFLFTGEVYRGLDFASLSKKEMELAQDQLRILSGMYGLLRPFDLMYPYRLEMGTKWAVTPKQKNLYAFWGDKLTKSLLAETGEDEVIVNLASSEYFKSIQWNKVNRRHITPVFKEFKGGEYKIVMTFAKHARGSMTRYILQNNCQTVDDLKLFDVDGYSFDVKQSTEQELVFVR
jgi:cytoplasmic iron level regulating protein YaaA (DUF328/UPF0246 family)